MKELILESEIGRRMFAGIWFALASAVPIIYYFAFNPFTGKGLPILGSSVILTALVPVFVSSICGLALGADILNASEIKNFGQAIQRGLAIGFLSYLILFTGTAGWLILIGDDDFVGALALVLIFFFYGLLFVGWLVALVSAAAGGFLFFFRLRVVLRRKQ